jgi:hypothetical protein
MGDIAAYMKNEKVSINDIKLNPQELAELIASIKVGTISVKIGKEVKVRFHYHCYFIFKLCKDPFPFPFLFVPKHTSS